MIKIKDLINKKSVFKTSENTFDSLKAACHSAAIALYKTKLFAAKTNLEAKKIKGKCIGLTNRFEREFLNEEYSKPDLDENSALLTLYVDAKNDILSLENILETTILPYYMVRELEKDLYSWCRFEKLNKKSGVYKILACIGETDSDFGSTTVWCFEERSYKPEVSNEN